MTEKLQEYCDSRGVPIRVDRQAGVIRGVKILGHRSRNGRAYLPEALAQAAPLYENAKVNVNHPKGDPTQPRDYRDRIGVIRDVSVRPDEGLFADFHFNPKHHLAEQLIWDAENSPENVGFSHNVRGRTAQRDGRVVVETITKVQSVDLVADPATTRGLFEAAASPSPASSSPASSSPASGNGEKGTAERWTVERLKRDRPELVEALAEEHIAEAARLNADVDRLQQQLMLQEKRETARRLLREAELPDVESSNPADRLLVGERFFESLLAAEDERAVRELIEERARLVRHCTDVHARRSTDAAGPRSRDQFAVEGATQRDTGSFVKAIT